MTRRPLPAAKWTAPRRSQQRRAAEGANAGVSWGLMLVVSQSERKKTVSPRPVSSIDRAEGERARLTLADRQRRRDGTQRFEIGGDRPLPVFIVLDCDRKIVPRWHGSNDEPSVRVTSNGADVARFIRPSARVVVKEDDGSIV